MTLYPASKVIVILALVHTLYADLCPTVCEQTCSCQPTHGRPGYFDVFCNDVTADNQPFLSCFNETVVTLILSGSDISHLGADDFVHLTNLEEFELEGSPLESIATATFTKALKLQRITIRKTSLTSLTGSLFTDLENLVSVNLVANNLSTLASDVFAKAFSLTEIDLSQNNIINITNGLFNDQINLQRLNMSYNYIQTLPGWIMANLSYLTELDLSNNKIDSADSNSLTGLFALKGLTLKGTYDHAFLLLGSQFHCLVESSLM